VGCLALLGGITLVPSLFTVVASSTGSATAGAVGVAAVPLIGIAATVWRSRRRDSAPVADAGPSRTPPAIASTAPTAPVAPDSAWRAARERFTGVQAEYARLECDPLEVLRLPALTDVTVPSTARFVDAFAAAQALLTDHHPGPRTGDAFTDAADAAERAWRAALSAAERIRLQNIDPAERSAVERVVKLLTTARDSDNEAERHLAYARARAELGRLDAAGVVHVPLPARAALDAVSRRELLP
jgi:hypothetical protein